MMISHKLLLPEETELLRDSLASLAAYHNTIADNKEITYPIDHIDDTIQALSENIANGTGITNAYFDNGDLIAFCSIGICKEKNRGELKYLFVRDSHRKHGFGDVLMQWALHEFDKAHIEFVDIRVVLGNAAIAFYEKYGFQPRIVVMSKKIRKQDEK